MVDRRGFGRKMCRLGSRWYVAVVGDDDDAMINSMSLELITRSEVYVECMSRICHLSNGNIKWAGDNQTYTESGHRRTLTGAISESSPRRK